MIWHRVSNNILDRSNHFILESNAHLEIYSCVYMCACPCPCPWPCPWKFLDRQSLTRGVQMCACPCPRPCPRPCPWMWIAPCSHSVRVDCISRTHTRGFPTSTWFLYTLSGINMAAKRKPCRAWRLDDLCKLLPSHPKISLKVLTILQQLSHKMMVCTILGSSLIDWLNPVSAPPPSLWSSQNSCCQ